MSRPIAIILALLALSISFSGCLIEGDEDKIKPVKGDPPTAAEDREIRAVLNLYAKAIGEHDSKTLCAKVYSAEVRDRLSIDVPCPDRVLADFGRYDDYRVRIVKVTITVPGRYATASVIEHNKLNDPVEGPTELFLSNAKQGWRIEIEDGSGQSSPNIRRGKGFDVPLEVQ